MRETTTAVHQSEVPQGTSWTFGTSWSCSGLPGRLLALAVAAVLGISLLAAPSQQRAAADATQAMADRASEVVRVIVRTVSGTGEVERSVEQLGGTVVDHIDLINGVVVDIDQKLLPHIRRAPGVVSVSFDRPVRMLSRRAEGDAVVGNAVLSHVRKVTGSTVSERRGFDGSGIGVAIVDTGVAAVAGLPKLEQGPATGGGTSQDGYGHGTHLAGIIAGNDGAGSEGFLGVASEASVVAVKAAADDGSTSLAAVLAGLDFVLDQKDERGIRVLNLSLGVEAQDDYRRDLLAVAVEKLWNAGIVVVVAAGNEGEADGSPLTSPAYDPFVIAVGSVDTKDTDSTSDDVVHAFSPRGDDARRVDLVAPGQSLVSLLAPGSVAATSYPAAHVGTRFIKGTGTSQAAAVVSAIAADLLEQRPGLSPDQVKALLRSSANALATADPGQGAGMVNLKKALATSTPANATQTFDAATGPLPASPQDPPPPPPADGDEHCDYDVLQGPPAPPAPPSAEADDDGMCGWSGGSWSDDGTVYTGGSWSGGSWSGGSWSGGSWSGGSWSGGSWSGGSWSVGTWSGGSWSGGSWSGGSWSGETFTGGSWSGGSWSGGSWSGGSWSGGSWSGGSWSGGSWSGGSWSGGSWSGGSWSGGSWSGGSWSGGSWSGGSWSGGSWSGGSWSGGSWSGGSWSGGSWSGGSWSGGSWSGGSWSGGSWSGGSWSGGSWSGGSWSGGSWSGGSWSGGSWSDGSWSGGSWSGGSWSGGSWSGDAWTGTSWL